MDLMGCREGEQPEEKRSRKLSPCFTAGRSGSATAVVQSRYWPVGPSWLAAVVARSRTARGGSSGERRLTGWSQVDEVV